MILFCAIVSYHLMNKPSNRRVSPNAWIRRERHVNKAYMVMFRTE